MVAEKRLNAKKFIIILSMVLFVLVALFCFVLLTTVKKVELHFAVGENTDVVAVQNVVDKNLGKNFLTVNAEEIESSLAEFSYVNVLSVKKKFPNVIKVFIEERREIYGVESENSVLVLGEDGHLLKTVQKDDFEFNRDVIKLDLGNVEIQERKLGQVLKTDSSELLGSVFDMTKSVNLNNSIKEISIIKYAAAGELSDVEFITYTGVKICVYKAEEMGIEKISAAFNVYDTQVSDYEKATFTLYASYNLEKGRVEVTWSDRAVDE